MKIIYKNRIIFGICLMLIACTLSAQIPEELKNELNKALDKMQLQIGSRSLSAAIQFKDGQVWSHAQGASSITIPVDENYLYLIGSVTKTITSATILQMADEGKLNLDDRIIKFLDPIQYIDTAITIRQMLRHESGIYDILESQELNNKMIQNQGTILYPKDIIPTYIKPAIFKAGAKWSYSNTNYFLLGMIIEKISGKTFYEEIRDRFYTPLALNSFAIPAFEKLKGNVAHAWLDITNDGKTDDAHVFYINYKALNSVAGAAGGYFANASDVSKWMRSYMRGDLLSKEMMDQAKQTVFASGMPSGGTYGLGLMKYKFQGIEAFGHGGDLVYSASSWYFPSLDISISVLNNDAKNNSWALGPVVSELLKVYRTWQLTADKDIVIDDDIIAYPNPFTNSLSIEVPSSQKYDKIEYVLSNIMGQKVASTYAIIGELVMTLDDINYLPQGLYTLSVIADNQLISRKKLIKT